MNSHVPGLVSKSLTLALHPRQPTSAWRQLPHPSLTPIRQRGQLIQTGDLGPTGLALHTSPLGRPGLARPIGRASQRRGGRTLCGLRHVARFMPVGKSARFLGLALTRSAMGTALDFAAVGRFANVEAGPAFTHTGVTTSDGSSPDKTTIFLWLQLRR